MRKIDHSKGTSTEQGIGPTSVGHVATSYPNAINPNDHVGELVSDQVNALCRHPLIEFNNSSSRTWTAYYVKLPLPVETKSNGLPSRPKESTRELKLRQWKELYKIRPERQEDV
ncbi:hypothetical protein VNO77_19922 [Canavalia gladiata]|uniref:Uncharacterized protein n=1 Tax=Canavalia gladiata TaxID=3824 RepID=A0AAN9LND6_CANGL